MSNKTVKKKPIREVVDCPVEYLENIEPAIEKSDWLF